MGSAQTRDKHGHSVKLFPRMLSNRHFCDALAACCEWTVIRMSLICQVCSHLQGIKLWILVALNVLTQSNNNNNSSLAYVYIISSSRHVNYFILLTYVRDTLQLVYIQQTC